MTLGHVRENNKENEARHMEKLKKKQDKQEIKN